MSRQKRLQDLTIKDNFMFGAVMSIEENCIAFLEMVLGFPIEKVVVSKERSMIYHPEYRGCLLYTSNRLASYSVESIIL